MPGWVRVFAIKMLSIILLLKSNTRKELHMQAHLKRLLITTYDCHNRKEIWGNLDFTTKLALACWYR